MKNKTTKLILAAMSAVIMLSVIMTFSAISVFAAPDDTQTNESISYTGAEIRPLMNISSGEVQLVEGEDYTVTYENNINFGIATATITFMGNYSGERRVDFNIMPQFVEDGNIKILPIEAQEYQGSGEIEPELTVIAGEDTVLVKGVDYNVSYHNNRELGTANVEVILTGNYSGTLNTTFEIVPMEITEEDVENGEIELDEFIDVPYKGTPYEGDIGIRRNGYPMRRGGEYEVVFENSLNVGTATVHINFINGYTGSLTRTFNIVPYNVENDMNNRVYIYPVMDVHYTGKEVKPDIVIVDRERYNY